VVHIVFAAKPSCWQVLWKSTRSQFLGWFFLQLLASLAGDFCHRYSYCFYRWWSRASYFGPHDGCL